MNILLTDEEIDKVVSDWVNVAPSARSVSLGRGHWEHIAPVIVKTQSQRIVKWLFAQCTEHHEGSIAYYRRLDCTSCLQALKEEVKDA